MIRAEGLIYVVLEFGETDLAHLLSKRDKQRAAAAAEAAAAAAAAGGGQPGPTLQSDDNYIRMWFEQMVEAVRTIHGEHIVHSDLKPANFLVVEGSLKLIDFGIAKSFAKSHQNEATDILREQQMGTLNYMAPEAILNGSSSALSALPIKARACAHAAADGAHTATDIADAHPRVHDARLRLLPVSNSHTPSRHKPSLPPS